MIRRLAAVCLVGVAATCVAVAVVLDPEALNDPSPKRRRGVVAPVDLLARWTKGGDA
jgi:hypothetical protein